MCEHPFYVRKKTSDNVVMSGYYVDCGSCISCKIKRAREWTIRVMLEADSYRKYDSVKSIAHFITLTYDKDHISPNYELNYKDCQDMFKRIRKDGCEIRYFICGEYGPKTQRPHYHMIVFGLEDEYVKENFTPEGPTRIWPHGYCHVGWFFTPKTVAYVAQYSVKKLKNKEYAGSRQAPFIHMSQGIGRNYIKSEENVEKMLQQGYISYQGHKYPVPRYYFKILNLDRSEYYSEFIQEQQEKLINRALDEKIVPFPPTVCFASREHYAKALKKAFVKGNVMNVNGTWRILTNQFMRWLEGLRMQSNLNLAAKYKNAREKN